MHRTTTTQPHDDRPPLDPSLERSGAALYDALVERLAHDAKRRFDELVHPDEDEALTTAQMSEAFPGRSRTWWKIACRKGWVAGAYQPSGPGGTWRASRAACKATIRNLHSSGLRGIGVDIDDWMRHGPRPADPS